MNKESFAAGLENLYILIFYFAMVNRDFCKILFTSVLKAISYSNYKTESALKVSRVSKPFKVSDSSFENLKISFDPTPHINHQTPKKI